MKHTFNFKNKVVEVSTDKSNWYVQYTDDDGLLNRYEVSYPQPTQQFIRVPFSWKLIRQSNNKVLQSRHDEYHETSVDAYYDAVLQPGQTYGSFAAIHALNGLIAREDAFDGDKRTATGYRVFRGDGSFYQPVIFDIINVRPETQAADATGTMVGQGNGGFEVQIHNGIAPIEWRLSTATGWRSVDTIYNNLAAGDYRVEVRDSVGTLRYADVTIPVQEPVEATA